MILNGEKDKTTLRFFEERFILFVNVNLADETKTKVLDGFLFGRGRSSGSNLLNNFNFIDNNGSNEFLNEVDLERRVETHVGDGKSSLGDGSSDVFDDGHGACFGLLCDWARGGRGQEWFASNSDQIARPFICLVP
jgi:hypothetical protein